MANKARRIVERCVTSGASPADNSAERTMNILDLKQNTFTNTSNKFQGIFSTTLIRFPHIIGILHCDHCSRHVSHVLEWKTYNFAKHFMKMQKSQSRKSLLSCPKSARLDVWRLPGIEAPGRCSSWRPPRRLWRAEAPQPRRGRSAPPSAAA